MIKNIKIFGEEISIKNYHCSSSPSNIIVGPYKFNLYIKVTDHCNASCSFCSNQGSAPERNDIDLNKLEKVVQELDEKNLLSRVSITGGEPFLNIKKLNLIINKVLEVKPNATITINTNGINFNHLYEIDNLDKLEGIHISRHHYNDAENNNIFGVKTTSLKEIMDINNKLRIKNLIRLNCLLLKGKIDSIDEVSRYLDVASEADIFRVGFVSLMLINEYCVNHFVDYNDVFSQANDKFLLINKFYDDKICECGNGIYLSDIGKVIEFYARMTKELNPKFTRQFVYTTSNELSLGFNKKLIKIK